jgi:hypothetical protein
MKSLLVVGILLVLSGVVAADEVYVPDNIPSMGPINMIPFFAEWTPISGQIRYQLMFGPTELGHRAFRVRDISFAAGYTGSFSASLLQVRMSHSPVGTLNATMDLNLPAPVTCYHAPIAMATTLDAWGNLGLTGTFDYNGNDYLVVDIRYLGGQTSLTGSGYRGSFRSAFIHRSWAFNNYNAVYETGQDRLGGLKTRLTVNNVILPTTIAGVGIARPGGTMNLTLSAPMDPALPYRAATSLGVGPIYIDIRTLQLSNDAIFRASVLHYLPTVFVRYAGVLDSQGRGLAKIDIVDSPKLIGVMLHSAFVTLDPTAPSGISSISNTYSFQIGM